MLGANNSAQREREREREKEKETYFSMLKALIFSFSITKLLQPCFLGFDFLYRLAKRKKQLTFSGFL